MKITPLLLAFIPLLILGGLNTPAETLTYPELVHRLTDLEHLATPPQPGENGALASSYDRNSKYDAASDKYINWDANGDGGGIVRQEGNESVLMDVQGPGCIWRTWSASTDKGHVKIYLDGATTPAVDLPFTGYFDGKTEPFTRPNIVYQTKANGFNNYTPIPFLKSCKIVADPGWGNYYHFNYTLFPAGTVVPTFALPLSAEDSAALDAANKILGNCGVDPAPPRPDQKSETKALTVNPGQTSTVAELTGEGAVTALKVKFDLPGAPATPNDLLRQLAIRITWDGQKDPAVWAPLGDFFGDAVIPAKYQSLPMGITTDGQWYSYWYMPFASGAKIEIENDSGIPVAMNWEVDHAPLTQPAGSLLRFHAKWHRDAYLPTRKDRWPDWTLLTTQGVGRYVGTQLHIWNPLGGWWGEGDEKFFVDGEKFPSTFGTGSEDYFGYAWSCPIVFNQALHGQPVNEGNQGHIDVHRWHIADNIPFQKTFEGNIEKYFGNTRSTYYAAVAYWYLSTDGTDPYPEVPVADRIGYYAPLPILKPDGVVEAENLRALNGGFDAQDMTSFGPGWSANTQLYWRPQKTGDRLDLQLPGMKAGKYEFSVVYTHAGDYGISQLSVNGTPVGPPTDLREDGVKVAPIIDLGTVTLNDGMNTIGVTCTGKDDKAVNDIIGIDYFKLVPAP